MKTRSAGFKGKLLTVLLTGATACLVGIGGLTVQAATPEEELAAVIAEMQSRQAEQSEMTTAVNTVTVPDVTDMANEAILAAQAAALAAQQQAAEALLKAQQLAMTGLTAEQAAIVPTLDLNDPNVQFMLTQMKIATTVEGLNQFAANSALIDRNAATKNATWTGTVLSKRMGAVYGPVHKEVYYNLNMDKVVTTLQNMGFAGEYWIRDDGVKMFGPYVMCAADQSLYPFGTTVETSLGTAIVCDTGNFGENTLLDIAANW